MFEYTWNEGKLLFMEGLVNDINDIVQIVRFDGWQDTMARQREVRKALRKTLLKYQMHREQDLFDRAYEYIE